jgi:hypothetical protein
VANSLFKMETSRRILYILLVESENINSLAFPGPSFKKRLEYIRKCDNIYFKYTY